MCGEVSVIWSSASCHVALMTTPMGRGVIDKAGAHVSDENRSAFSKSNNKKCTSGSEIFCIVHEHHTSDALPSCVVWRRAPVSGSATFGNVFLCLECSVSQTDEDQRSAA